MTYVWASKVFASVLEHLKHNVKVLTGRGAIIGSENILGLVSSPAICCRMRRGRIANKQVHRWSRQDASFGVSLAVSSWPHLGSS
jgi:hypothetical protein